MDFYLILALGTRNGLGYCVVNRHKLKGEIIIITTTTTTTTTIIIITIIIIIIIIIIVHHLSQPRGRVKKSLKCLPREVKKSLKPLPRGVRKADNNIKHYKTTADSVLEWLTLYGDDEGTNTAKGA